MFLNHTGRCRRWPCENEITTRLDRIQRLQRFFLHNTHSGFCTLFDRNNKDFGWVFNLKKWNYKLWFKIYFMYWLIIYVIYNYRLQSIYNNIIYLILACYESNLIHFISCKNVDFENLFQRDLILDFWAVNEVYSDFAQLSVMFTFSNSLISDYSFIWIIRMGVLCELYIRYSFKIIIIILND